MQYPGYGNGLLAGSFMDNVILVLVVVALLGAVCYVGARSASKRPGQGREGLSRDYFIGLNYLLNDEPDEAVDTFINALEVNADTLETHMALGILLRRRGKVDKSIGVYQKVLERSGLSRREGNRVKVELAKSYVAAGLHDRAESLLENLRGADPEIEQHAQSLAINMYQVEKDWEKAVQAAAQLLKVCSGPERRRYQLMASHFYCELAEKELERKRYGAAGQLLNKAGRMSPDNVRVSLMTGRMEMARGNYRDAIRVLMRAKQRNADFESETFIPLLKSYHEVGSERHLRKFIQSSLAGQPSSSVVVGISHDMEHRDGQRETLNFLLDHLRRRPSLKIMSRALAVMGSENGQGGASSRRDLLLIHDIMEAYLNERTLYRCENCGYEAKSLHWLCPSCSEWGEIKPAKGMMGE